MNYHLAVAHDVEFKWYECPHCAFLYGKKFKNLDHLIKHMKFKHNIIKEQLKCTFCNYEGIKTYIVSINILQMLINKTLTKFRNNLSEYPFLYFHIFFKLFHLKINSTTTPIIATINPTISTIKSFTFEIKPFFYI